MLRYISRAPVSVSANYISYRIPSGVYLNLTELETRLLALRIMDSRGELSPADSKLLRTPLFGRVYVAEGGDIDATLARIAIDFLPGATLIRFI